MTPIDLGSYKSIYLQTAKEYIDSLLVACNKLVSDSQDKDVINQIHIASHSLKSQSQVMGFIDIANLSASIEKISNDLLNGVSEIDDKFITFLKKSVDELNLKIAQIEKGNAE